MGIIKNNPCRNFFNHLCKKNRKIKNNQKNIHWTFWLFFIMMEILKTRTHTEKEELSYEKNFMKKVVAGNAYCSNGVFLTACGGGDASNK